MPYNLGMNQLTLVLPLALPPPELAPDLLRAMQTPALAALVSRTSQHRDYAFDNGTRVLPHQTWLAHALGLGGVPGSDSAGTGFARAAMTGFGLPADQGHWMLVHPVHVQIARNHLMMGDQRSLSLADADARTLFDAAKPYFDDAGKPLFYGDAQTWFMRADDWADLTTASPDAACGQNLNAYMQEGASARASRKLQNEVQMLWHAHPVNAAREQRGQPPINSFWLWAGASPIAHPAAPAAQVYTADCPAWLAALTVPARRSATLAGVLADGQQDTLVVLGSLAGPGLASEWSEWLMHMQQMEQHWFVPLLAALKDGRLARLKLVLDHRDAYAEFDSSKNAQRKFWRKRTLNNLKTPLNRPA